MNNVKLIAGRANPELAKNIANHLNLPLVKCKNIDFSNGEIYIEIEENIRASDVYFITTGAISWDRKYSTNDGYVEAIQVADACRRAGVKSIGIVYALFPYARSDKKDKSRVSIMTSVISNGLKNSGYNKIISMDIHSGQIQGTTDISFDNLYAVKLHMNALKDKVFNMSSPEEINNRYVLVSPDVGGSKRIRDYAERLEMMYAIMDKQRDYSKPNTVAKSVLIGTVVGKTAIILDDILDTLSTVLNAINDLMNHGAKDVIIVATHGILSGPAIERINNCNDIKMVIVTNTIDQKLNLEKCEKLTVVDVSSLFGKVIECHACGGSISSLFK